MSIDSSNSLTPCSGRILMRQKKPPGRPGKLSEKEQRLIVKRSLEH